MHLEIRVVSWKFLKNAQVTGDYKSSIISIKSQKSYRVIPCQNSNSTCTQVGLDEIRWNSNF